MECEKRLNCPKMAINDPNLKEYQKWEIARRRCLSCTNNPENAISKPFWNHSEPPARGSK